MYTKAAVPVLRSRDFTSYECLLGYKLYGNPTKINICTSLLFSQFRKEIKCDYISENEMGWIYRMQGKDDKFV